MLIMCRQFSCDRPNCTRTFSRASDLTRHRKTIHARQPYWCSVHSCRRRENYSNRKRPFWRKDNLNEHIKGFISLSTRTGVSSSASLASPLIDQILIALSLASLSMGRAWLMASLTAPILQQPQL
ncbi:hypothetical protein BGZ63DRAFT_137531 [Mariannaea sp. PMI_226]|nr:hypothetical protein BGZ63DRAFT_137531 [Mariannaea sp. PMI_226]